MRPGATAYNQEQAWGGVRFALVISTGHAGALCPPLSRVPVKECESSGKRHPTHQPPLVLGELAVGSGWVRGAPSSLCKAGLPRELSSGDRCCFLPPASLWFISAVTFPASRQRVFPPRKSALWTDLVMTCGLKTAPFSSHAHTHTHTHHTPTPPHAQN